MTRPIMFLLLRNVITKFIMEIEKCGIKFAKMVELLKTCRLNRSDDFQSLTSLNSWMTW
jgi:hypothetical protein